MLKADLSENMQRIDQYLWDAVPMLLKNNQVRVAYNMNYLRLMGTKKDLDTIELRLENSNKFQTRTTHKLYRNDNESLYICNIENAESKKVCRELIACLIGEQVIAYQAEMMIKHQEFIDALKAINEEIA